MTAARMGYHAHIFTPENNAPASEVSKLTTRAEYTHEQSLRSFAESVHVVTFEFENIPHRSLELLSGIVPVYPSPAILEMTQHRVREKEFCRLHGIGTAQFARVHDAETLAAAVKEIGTPAILKTCELGYDGKGQASIQNVEDAAAAWENLGKTECVLEGFVPFVMEVSVLVARNASGEVATYPVVQNIHKNHILKETIAPAPVTKEVSEQARAIALTLAEKTGLVGLLAVEMFVTKTGEVLVNEMAPRPHNSGHWTMDACATSQFEQQLRAVCNLPLGKTTQLCPANMINLIGDDVHDWESYLKEYPFARLHLYGKEDVRPGRKMGHVNILQPKL